MCVCVFIIKLYTYMHLPIYIRKVFESIVRAIRTRTTLNTSIKGHFTPPKALKQRAKSIKLRAKCFTRRSLCPVSPPSCELCIPILRQSPSKRAERCALSGTRESQTEHSKWAAPRAIGWLAALASRYAHQKW